jgi:hypothetical protein
MSRHKKQPTRMAAFIRPGEGHAVEIVRRVTPRPDGAAALEIGLDLGNAPVPERRYTADIVSVKYSGESLKWMFGQEKIGGGLRSLVIVCMTPEAISQFLATCTQFTPSLRQYVESQQLSRTKLVSIDREPEQTVEMSANMVAAAHVGREACMDFYHASPRSFRDAMQSESTAIAIEPVVRILLSANLMLSALEEVEAARSSFSKEAEQ